MAITFSLSDESKKRLHPEALRCFNDCIADIEEDLPEALKNLNEDDLTFLSTNGNKHPLQTHFNKMLEVLSKYTDIEEGAAVYSEVKSTLALPVASIKCLLSDAYLQKLIREQRRQLEEGVECIAEILGFKREDISRIHLHALERLNDLNTDMLKEVPQLNQLNINEINADLNAYLNDDKTRFEKCKAGIAEWLCKCTNIDNGYSSHSPIYDTWVISDINEFKSLIRKAYETKAAKLEAERKQREWEEKWDVAYEAISPPDADAHKYLSPEEYQKYEDSIPGAVRVYMKKTKLGIGDGGSFDYRWWSEVINNRREEERQRIANEKEEERQKIVANIAAKEYNRRLNEEKARLKALLFPKEKDTWSYLQNHIKARCYREQPFRQILSSEEIEAFDRTINNIGKRKLGEIVSSDFHQFIEGVNYRAYYFLPIAEYSYDGLPCIDFGFEVLAVVEVRVSLKPGRKTFGDYTCNLPWKEEKGYSVVLKEPELLGYHYFVLAPEDLGGYTFWQTIPLVLLTGLLNGEIKPKGITISAASDGILTYKIPKFKEEVTIPDSFAGYLRNIGSIDEMVSMGIMAEKVGDIVKSELGELKVEQKPSLLKDRIERKDTKKAKAFRLFDEGKTPSDREVKALKIKSKSSYNYYQEWKKITRQ